MTTNKEFLLLSTRKGLITYRRNKQRWQYQGTSFAGIPVSFTHVDPHSHTWWACLDHGHWGVKLHRSSDKGAHWEEVEAPTYPEWAEIKPGEPATVKYLWAMTSAGPNELYLGTIPGGLFKSTDNGDSFTLVESLWKHPSRVDSWFGGGYDNPGIHSIIIDPEDSNHLFVGISVAGVFESTDGGESWAVRNKGLRADFLPDPQAEVGHDPHLLVACPQRPKVMWQQNHCGIFRSTDGGASWQDVSQNGGPANFGFAIAVDEQNPDRAWVVPALSDEKRVAIDEALCVCRTDDGGQSWQTFRKGLPQEQCFDITYRHALALDGDSLVFGTTTGNVFLSENGGEAWKLLAHTLPMVYAVEMV